MRMITLLLLAATLSGFGLIGPDEPEYQLIIYPIRSTITSAGDTVRTFLIDRLDKDGNLDSWFDIDLWSVPGDTLWHLQDTVRIAAVRVHTTMWSENVVQSFSSASKGRDRRYVELAFLLHHGGTRFHGGVIEVWDFYQHHWVQCWLKVETLDSCWAISTSGRRHDQKPPRRQTGPGRQPRVMVRSRPVFGARRHALGPVHTDTPEYE